MFGNNITSPYMSYGPMMQSAPMINAASMGMRSAPMMGMGNSSMMGAAPRSGGLLSSLFGLGGRNTSAGGLLSGARSFNFGSLLNNASKALGVVNQAIPIVKEVAPMMGNMKSILKIASVFKDETDTRTISPNTTSIAEDQILTENQNKSDTRITSTTTNQTTHSEPNFFL